MIASRFRTYLTLVITRILASNWFNIRVTFVSSHDQIFSSEIVWPSEPKRGTHSQVGSIYCSSSIKIAHVVLIH